MLEGVKGFFRSRALAKYASTEPTRITPIGKIRSAVAFIDVEDTSFNECKVALMNFFRERDIKGDIFFFDFRKLTEGERLITSITTTVLRKDLNWYGRPAREKVDLMLEGEPDMFISLLRKSDFPIHFMAAASKAHVKVGRVQLPGNIFDVVVSDPEDAPISEFGIFREMCILFEKIQ